MAESHERSATVLERAIARAQQGSLDVASLLWTLAASDVVLINETAPGDAFPAQPVVVGRDGARFLALFTHRDRAGGLLQGERVIVHVPALEIIRRVPEGTGVVVNPGDALGFEVPADGWRAFALDVMETPMPA